MRYQGEVAAGLAELDALLWAQARQAGPAQKVAVLLLQQQVAHAKRRGERHIHHQLGNNRVDIQLALDASHRDPVVPIFYKEDIAELVELDRGERDRLVVRAVHAHPAVLGGVVARGEAAVEVRVAALAAHNMVQRYGLVAKVVLPAHIQAGAHLLQAQQLVRAAVHNPEQLRQEGLAPRAVKIFTCDVVDPGHVSLLLATSHFVVGMSVAR